MTAPARQGHVYQWNGNRVVALEGGDFPRVCVIDPAWQWISPPVNVDAAELQPLPMKYYGGSVPT